MVDTVLWLDGFDHYDITSLDEIATQYNLDDESYPVAANPRTGTQALSFNNGESHGFLGKNIGAIDIMTVGIGFYPTLTGVAHSGGIVITDDFPGAANPFFPGNANCGSGFRLERDATNSLNLVQFDNLGNETDIWNSDDNKMIIDSYTYIEMKLDTVAQEITIFRNGIVAYPTIPITYASLPKWVFLGKGTFAGNAVYFDDFYVTNGIFLHGQRCYLQLVASDDAPQDWTLSGGANGYALLDSPVYNAADYVEAAAVNDISKFGIGAFPAANADINAIAVVARQNISGAGIGGTKQTMTLNAIDYTSPDDHALSTTPAIVSDIFSVIGSGITKAMIDALTLEMEKTV